MRALGLSCLLAACLAAAEEPGDRAQAPPLTPLAQAEAIEARESVTEVEPGFLVEPVSLTTTVVSVLSENRPSDLSNADQAGMVVRLVVHAPVGRTLRSVSAPRLIEAKDDQGRDLKAVPSLQQVGGGQSTRQAEGEPTSQRFELHLALPPADARAVERLEGVLTALTSGGWNEMSLTNVQSGTERDLSQLLPSAKIFIKEVKVQGVQVILQIELSGHTDVQHMDLKVRSASGEVLRGQLHDRPGATEGLRALTLYGFDTQGRGEALHAPITLLLRFPTGLKRERVHFVVTGLDLL